MAIKCIGIGNRLMGDDAVGLVVLDTIADRLQTADITAIYGETDAYYALSRIEDGDLLFIFDAALQGNSIGTVLFIPFDQLLPFYAGAHHQHGASLFHLLSLHKPNVTGFAVAIETSEPTLSLEISEELKIHIPHIANDSLEFILKKAEEYYHA